MAAITIRKAHDEDAALIASFNRAHAKEIDGITLPEETALRGAVEGLRHSQYCQYYLAETEAQVVGLVMITYEWSDWRAGLLWWMQSVYVLPGFRGRGVFQHALQAYRNPGPAGPASPRHSALCLPPQSEREKGLQPAGVERFRLRCL